MRFLLPILAILAVPFPALAHDGPEDRTAFASEAVIRNNMRQMGVTVRSVTMRGQYAIVEGIVGGRPARLQTDRIGGATHLQSGNATVRSILTQRLKHRLSARPLIGVAPVITIQPKPTIVLQPKPRTVIQPKPGTVLQPQGGLKLNN